LNLIQGWSLSDGAISEQKSDSLSKGRQDSGQIGSLIGIDGLGKGFDYLKDLVLSQNE
jgi:hypothetical protein